MAEFSIEIKPSALKELDALDDGVFTRVDRKILGLADNPRPAGSKKLRGYKICGGFVLAIGAWSTSLMTQLSES